MTVAELERSDSLQVVPFEKPSVPAAAKALLREPRRTSASLLQNVFGRIRSKKYKRVFFDVYEDVKAFNMDVVLQAWGRENGYDWQQCVRYERELKRFLAMAGVYADKFYYPRGEVYGLWVTLMSYTRLYEEFCRDSFSRFIHHWPPNTTEGASYPRAYADFIEDYQQIFEEIPPHDLWPDPIGWDDKLGPRA